ncbi:MAG: DUF4369 domain-containing protein [Bacteroidales bacterium]|nr:DUF4369 domain-containing protein [Bacteroidales bacterium]
MKKNILFLLALCSCVLFSCQNKKGQIVIEGKLKHANNEWIRIGMIGENDLVMLDSMKMKNGEFSFVIPAETDEQKARAASPMMYQIILTNDNTLTTLAKGGEHIVIEADAQNLLSTYHIHGGEECELMAQLDSALTSFVNPTNKLFETYEKNVENDSIRNEIEQKYVVLLQKHKDYLTHFIQKHPNNMASFIAFYQSYNRRSFFSEQGDLDLLKKITTSLQKQYPDNPYVKNMKLRVEMLELVGQEQTE